MAKSLATDGFSPQPSKLFQEKRPGSRLNAGDVRRERQFSGAAALLSPGTDPVLFPGAAAGLGQGGKTNPICS